MRPYLMLCMMFIWLASAMTASAGEPTLTLDVWPDKAPGETGSIGPEKVIDQKPGDKPVKLLTNVTHPTLSVFRTARDRLNPPQATRLQPVVRRVSPGGLQPVPFSHRSGISKRVMIIVNDTGTRAGPWYDGIGSLVMGM